VGNCLGELTDELEPGDGIVRFCSTGPKTYAYETRDGKRVVKSKGVPVGSAGVDIEKYEEMVVKAHTVGPGREILQHKVVFPLYFQKNCATSEIHRVRREKTLQYTYDKRIVVGNYRTRPFGTKQ
jgi:hypothetical protein